MNSLDLVHQVGRLAVLRQGVKGLLSSDLSRVALRLHQLDYENLTEGMAAVWGCGAPHWPQQLEHLSSHSAGAVRLV